MSPDLTPEDKPKSEITHSVVSILDLASREDRNRQEVISQRIPRFNIKRDREKTRSLIAYALIALLAAVVFWTLWLFSNGKAVEDVKSLLEVLFAPLIAIIGTILGFYFGTETAKGEED